MTSIDEELRKNGRIVFKNKGVSMMPLLRQDKDVMIIEAKREGFKKGDAVLFRRREQYVMHRITKDLGNKTFYIIGDNCISGEIVKEEQIIGILTGVQRDGKLIQMTDKKYLRYVRTVPFRRALLKVKTKIRAVLSRVYHKVIKRDR